MKRRANPYAFSQIPKSLYDPGQPYPALALSRLLAGVARGDRSTTSLTGREIEIPAGSTWVSIQSVTEDISSAIGQVLPRHVVKYALRKLESSGVVSGGLMLPETRGRYGKLYTISDEVMTEQDTIDPVTEYRIHAYGKTTAFTHGAVASQNAEDGWIQRQNADNMKLMRYVAENGSKESLFRTVGMWRNRQDVRDAMKPVFIPWIVLDIDLPGDIPNAHDACLAIISDLEDAGFDLNRCFASFSGSKGFHIAVSTDHFGSPVFRTSDSARNCMMRFVKTITDHKFDPATMSPLQMLRLTGSTHSKTGRVKRTWTVERFRSLQLHQILSATEQFEPWQYPDPTVGDVEQEIQSKFETVAAEQAVIEWDAIMRFRANPNDWDLPGSSLRAALNGVSEGQAWGKSREGRDWAAFTIACYLFAKPEQHGYVRSSILELPDDGPPVQTFSGVMDTLSIWNDRNNPPLTNIQLAQKCGSAERYLTRRQKI